MEIQKASENTILLTRQMDHGYEVIFVSFSWKTLTKSLVRSLKVDYVKNLSTCPSSK